MPSNTLNLLRRALTNDRRIFLGGMPIASADIPPEPRAGIPTSAIYGQPRRYQIRFPDADVYKRHMSSDTPPATFRTPVHLDRRLTLAIEVPSLVPGKRSGLENEVETLAYFQNLGCSIMEDYLYASDLTTIFDEAAFRPPQDAEATLDDVTRLIRADACRDIPLRDDVVIAVVDTGIDGRHAEFAEGRRFGSWQARGEKPWSDWKGHGTMCAAIAAGSRASGGRYDGVAAGAPLIACRTRLRDTELAAVYEYLMDSAKEHGWRIVATNSFGVPTGAAPPPDNSVFMETLSDAISAGIVVVFSAGNYHELTGAGPSDCAPTSIWQYKCRNDVLTVGTCGVDGIVWSYSSRGPGKSDGPGTPGEKPDVIAPTPRNGAVLYGGSVRVLANGWGTSGAAPQAAALASLLLSRDPRLSSGEVFEHIRAAARPGANGHFCEGAGLIDCRAALDRV